MKLSKLKKKYPEAFEKFYNSKDAKSYLYELDHDNDIREHWRGIVDFMDSQGIVLTVDYLRYVEKPNGYKIKIMFTDRKPMRYTVEHYIETRKQAETKAICKAFEILEERIKP